MRRAWTCWVLLAVLACAVGGPVAAESATAAAAPDPLPDPMRNALIWVRDQPHMVNLDAAKSVNANVVNVYPAPEREGSWAGSLKPLPMMVEGMDKAWRADVEELHKAGIAVWTSYTTISFEPEIFEEYGLDPETYYARDPEGNRQPHLGGYYGEQVFTSCYNNPHWMDLQRETALLFIENGFDGVFYDVGGYADKAVLYCHCDHCKKKWQEYLREKGLDPEAPLPTSESGEEFTQAVNRHHLRWRYRCWEEAWAPVREAVKAANPRFALGTNMSARVDDNRVDGMFVNAMMDVYDYTHFEEWGHGAAPYSILCSYLMARSAGGGKPAVIVWNMGPFDSPAQERVANAEALAAGAVCQNSRRPEVRREYHDFVAQNEDLFRDSKSLANVGVVVSLWSRAFHEIPKGEHAAWKFGQMLVDLHVPFDYLIAERDLTEDVLSRYDTLVLPNVACLTDEQVEVIDAFLRNGGGVYATGETGRYDTEMSPRSPGAVDTWAGEAVSAPFQREVGAGRLAAHPGLPEKEYWDANPRDPQKETPLRMPTPPTESVRDALAWVLRDSLPLETDAEPSTALVPMGQDDRLILHCVNYNAYPDGKEVTPDRDISLRLALPEGRAVKAVRVVSPDWDEARTVEGWTVEDGRLEATLDELVHYAVCVVDLASSEAAAPSENRPKVLILGDSISIGYTKPVAELLQTEAHVERPGENCQSTWYALEKLDEWLGDGDWDVIHFNWGIWDAHHLEDGEIRTTQEEYEANLRQLVARLKATGARLIWATITPITTLHHNVLWVQGTDIPLYNETAKRVMEENGVPINDLHEAVTPRLDELRMEDAVHYNPSGNAFLAEHVARAIRAALADPATDNTGASGPED